MTNRGFLMMGTIKRFEDRAITVAILWALLLAAGAPTAQAEGLEEVREFHIEAQALDAALIEFSEQADLQLMVPTELVAGRHSPGISGEYAGTVALAALLDDYGLSFTAVGADTVAVSGNGEDNAEGKSRPTSRQVLMAQNQASAQQTQTGATKSDDDEEEELELERITVVTGTHIRGIAPESSPVRTYTREDIQISGAATAQDFIQTLTANFGGGSNADLPAGTPNNINSGENRGFGSSVNLRGLGSGSTLVLLNGHRLAPSSRIGDFVDISMIPASAIERVEVLTDGASSIYGSDAVAGVVNFILREDFEGVETSLRYGVGTQHSAPEEFRASVTWGRNWDNGHALLSYEYFNQDNISAADRSFSEGAQLPQDLQPSQERHSVLGTFSQDLSSKLDIFADIIFSEREAVRDSTFTGTNKSISSSDNLTISTGGTWNAVDSWFVNFSGTYSNVGNNDETTGSSPGSTETESQFWTADISASGTVFHLPGGDVRIAFGGHYRREDFEFISTFRPVAADRDVYAAFGEAFIPIVGPDNAVPGIERLEINVSARFDDYSDFGSTLNPKVGVLWSPVESVRLRGSYSESFNPPPLGTIGSTNSLIVLAINNAAAFPALGIIAADPSIAEAVQLLVRGPSRDLDAETSRAFTAGLDFDQQWGRDELAVSTTWFDIKFENRLGITPCSGCGVNNLNAPNIAFNDPRAFPVGTIIFFPSQDQIADIVNRATQLVANLPPFFGDPFEATIINRISTTRNLASTFVSGLDFDLLYTHHAEIGDLTLGIGGSYILENKLQATATTPAVEQLNTLYNPVDLRLRGRFGYARAGLAANMFVNYVNSYRVDNTADATPIDSWTTADLSLSYDTQSSMGNSIFNDMVFRLSVINLFDQDPPSTPGNSQFGIFEYDPTNASPLGRFIAFEATKRF